MSDALSPLELSTIQVVVDVLERFGAVRVRVTGSSMLPAILPGDVVTVHRCSTRDARPGDVAVFIRGGRLFAHRVVHRSADTLVTQGDGVPSPDPPVSAHEFLGLASSVSRNGTCVSFAKDTGLSSRVIRALVRRSPRASRLLQRAFAVRLRPAA